MTIIASDATYGLAFRANEASLRKRVPIDAEVFFPSVAPTVHVVVANDIEESQKLRSRGVGDGFGRNVIAANRDGTRGVFRVKYFQELSESLRALRSTLIANLVAGAPQYNGGMVAIALDKISYVSLVPFVK